jgi:carbonic anhydrase
MRREPISINEDENMCDTKPMSTPSTSRRDILLGMGAVVGTALVPGQLAAQTSPQNAIPPDAALKRIMDGNARYVAGNRRNRDFSAGRAARAKSQHPVAAILSCADSRVAPELLFDEGPGDLFVVRIAGNFATAFGIASLEYAVAVLGVPLIMVLGHSSCGAVDAAVKAVTANAKFPGHLPQLVDAIVPAVGAAKAKKPKNLLEASIQENVRGNVAKLASAEPIFAGKVRDGKVRIVGGEYQLATGKVTLL